MWIGNFTGYETNKRTNALSRHHQIYRKHKWKCDSRSKPDLIGVAVFSTYVELSQGICHVLHLVPNIKAYIDRTVQ